MLLFKILGALYLIGAVYEFIYHLHIFFTEDKEMGIFEGIIPAILIASFWPFILIDTCVND